ncbi:MAG: tryptophan synthase subunit alpha [Phycisphaerales bacterium JB039]
MNRIDAIFSELRAQGRRALMPFVCAGRPAPGRLAELLEELERSGASIVEIGFAFSDPIADGPVIAAAMHKALEAGTTPTGTLREIEAARGRVRCGLVGMLSVSIVQRLGGPGGFCRSAAGAGLDGLIVPDAPLEEAEALGAAAREAGLTFSLLVSPTTPEERVGLICAACSGFVYLLARAGVTGERAEAPQVAGAVRRLRQVTDLPIACGFGITTAEHVREVVRHADAAIVGSALARRMEEAAGSGSDAIAGAGALVRELATGLAV